MKNVLIVGAGALGRAMAAVLATKPSLKIETWDRAASGVSGQQRPLNEAAAAAEAILVCTPTDGVQDVATAIASAVKPETIVLTFAKGLHPGSGKSAFEVLEATLGSHAQVGVVGGPLLASELTEGRGGVAVVASRGEICLRAAAEMLDGTQVDVIVSGDPATVSAVGALKNIYAVALGVCDHLEWGYNEKGWFIAQALDEMRQLLVALQLDPEVAWQTAGLGDLVATVFSSSSRNRAAGRELAERGTASAPSEGLRSVPLLLARVGDATPQQPILAALQGVVTGGVGAFEAFSSLGPQAARS